MPTRPNLSTALRLLGEAINRLPAAEQRLEEAQPGWPAGSSGGTGGQPGSGPRDSQPERLWSTLDDDPALGDLLQIRRLSQQVTANIVELHALVSRWSTARPGVEGPDDNDAWCRSCRRVGLASPVERAGLCDWCRRFKYTEGGLPSVDLLQARKAGRRITQAMVNASLREEGIMNG